MGSKGRVTIACLVAVACTGAVVAGLGLGTAVQAQSNGQEVQNSTPQRSLPSDPQVKTQQPNAPPVIRAYTRMVVVDVIATDAKGHAIHDLKNEDLKVFEDGKEQKIRAFAFHQPNVGVAPQEAKLADHEVT